MAEAIRVEDDGAVRHLVLCRPDELNTITPQLRDQLDQALDGADVDKTVKVVLLRAEGTGVLRRFRPRLVNDGAERCGGERPRVGHRR